MTARAAGGALWADVAKVHGLAPRRCRPGRSSRSAAPPSPPRRSRTPSARGRAPRWRNLVAGRRLDRYRPAGHHRGRAPLGRQGRRARPGARRRMDDAWTTPQSALDADRGADASTGSTRRWRARPTRCSKLQRPDGHWVFELEADATIPAEYVLFVHYLGETAGPGAGAQDRRLSAPHPGRARRLAALSRRRPRHVSATVKAYFALKMIGDDPDAPHMVRAREALLAHGGGAAPATSSPASCWRCSAASRGAPCRRCRSRSCCCRGGSRSTSRQDLLLGAHGDRAAAGAAQAEAAGARTRAASASTSCSCEPPRPSPSWPAARTRRSRGRRSSSRSTGCCASPSRACPKGSRQRAIDKARGLRRRAAERRGRPGRHLSRPWSTA